MVYRYNPKPKYLSKEYNMEFNDFIEILENTAKKINIGITKEQASSFYKYMNLLLEWNVKMNLTAITEPDEVILKHFIDSVIVQKIIKQNAKVIDIGTGAGFPGIPLAIIRNELDITLMDSLNKRINFLQEVIHVNKLSNVKAIHSRAEELARNNKYREKFDVAISRAVAPLNILVEYMLPYVRVNGYCICMKGPGVQEEIEKATNALKILNGTIEKVEKYKLPESDINRSVIIIKKIGNTPQRYPRKPGMPTKEPL